MHAPRRVIMLFVFLCIAFVLLAEIAPEEYRNMQLGAPDVVDIRVPSGVIPFEIIEISL